ncbi:MAG TPA: efflux RND transporter permease subunit, partial [Lentzea sp.]
ATLLTFIGTVAIAVALYVVVPKGFFPQQDTGIIVGLTDAPQDVSFDEMVRLERRLTEVIAADPAVASWGAFVGGGRPLNNGFVVVGLKPRAERDATADEVINRLRGKIAAVPGGTAFLQAAQDLNVGGRTSRTQYQYTLQDANIDELNEWGPRLLEELNKLPQLRDVASDQQSSSTMVSLVIDRDQAARFGIQPSLINNTLYDAFGQRQVTQYFTQLNSYHVVLEVLPSLLGQPDTLNKIYIKSPTTGQQVPLSTFAKFDTGHTSYLSINHQGQFPAVTLSFNLAPGVALGDAVTAIQKTTASIHMPDAILGTFQGTAQAFQASLSSMPLLVAAAILVVYIVLGVLYESYIHPITILSALPSAGVGALLLLMLLHYELSVIAIVGIILLIGIVKKNAIMMIDFALQAERLEGKSPQEAIHQACLLRFRPIMMTTFAALFGAMPIAFGSGGGAELRQPLGVAIVGGLLVSQWLTLYTTPVVYLYLERFARWIGRPYRPSRVQMGLTDTPRPALAESRHGAE